MDNAITFSTPSLVNNYLHSFHISSQGLFVLPDQIDGENYDERFASTPCCMLATAFETESFTANVNATFPSETQVWTPTSNPFGGTTTNPVSTVEIRSELKIPVNFNITIQGMTFKFAPRINTPFLEGASVIIEGATTGSGLKGGKLILDNSIFTHYDNCGNGMWEGIEMWGDINASQLPVNNTRQPQLIIRNASLIENSYEAIRVWKPGDFFSTGGIVQASNSTFRNNWRCAEFISYQNFNPNSGNALTNQSHFRNCIFETTTDYLNDDVTTPYAFLTFWDVWRINLSGNIYRNTSTQIDKAFRGTGIVAIDARLNINYSCNSLSFPCPATSKNPSEFIDLYYGVNLASSNPINTSTINECNFTNCFRGALLRGMDFAAITESNFVIGAAYMTQNPYGIYTDNCSSYKIEGNDFTTNSSDAVGTYTWLSGNSPNRIFRNTFSNVLVGSIAAENNLGLQYRCNAYSNISYYDIAKAYKDIYAFQGWCDNAIDDPADNTFSYGLGFDLYNAPSSSPFVYFHHTGVPYDPATLTTGIAESDCNHTYNANLHCRPTTGIVKPRSQLFAEKSFFQNEAENLEALIDGGNTQVLLDLIANGSAGNVKNGLLAASPYLSDAVLLAYIASNPPEGILKQVIIANSPVTQDVMAALDEMNLPAGIVNNIDAIQTGNSERYILEGRIEHYKRSAWLTVDEIVRDYLNDTIIDNPLDSVANVLKLERREMSKCQYVATLIAKNDIVEADDEIVQHKLEHDGHLDNYCKLLEILLDLKKAQQSCSSLPQDKEQRVRIIADEIDEKGCAMAQTLLWLAFNEHFEETIILPGELPENRKTEFATEASGTAASKLRVYPNPFNSSVTIEFINMNILNPEVRIMDIYGRFVKIVNIPEGSLSATIDLSNQNEGVYFYQIIQQGKIIQSGKVIKAKN